MKENNGKKHVVYFICFRLFSDPVNAQQKPDSK